MSDFFSKKSSMPHRTELPRVVLADTYTVVRFGLRTVLESRQAAQVVGEAQTPRGLLNALESAPCDVVIMDLALTDPRSGDGAALVKYLTHSFPNTQMLIITAVRSPGVLNAVIRQGAKSLVERSADINELMQALQLAVNGKGYLSKGVKQLLAKADLHPGEGPRLTIAEQEVLRLFAYEGLTSRQISDRLHRSRKTISHHKRSLQAKLGLMTDQELINYCHSHTLESLVDNSNPF